jgi:hypothetical protein
MGGREEEGMSGRIQQRKTDVETKKTPWANCPHSTRQSLRKLHHRTDMCETKADMSLR